MIVIFAGLLILVDQEAFCYHNRVMPTAIVVPIAVGLSVPMLAALVPVLGGARIGPHQAISSYGIGAGFGRGRLDRLVGCIRFLPRPMTLSLRNMFRRKVRVVLTLLTLTLGGVIFIMVMSVGQSLNIPSTCCCKIWETTYRSALAARTVWTVWSK